MSKDDGEINPQRWQPLDEPKRSQSTITYSDIKPGDTFQYMGENWRKFEGGYRRQVGRAPKVLKPHLPSDTQVWRAN